ncbi:response regulator transcription factor [Butyrivibrio sp. JL13D10]|uniref:response regulator transcription factor n=1 Tax=Butyrivibrio sp. JL13D10 TaxID=3236815 RepID=UPI0038B50B77
MEYTVLGADDEVEILDSLELFLSKEGIRLIKADNGISALELYKKEKPQMVLLDVMMPGIDGFSVLRKIRDISHVPVIMLTAKNEDYDKILGLELGADDYISKPFNPMEVVARIKAQLRRNYDYHESFDNVFKAFGIELNTDAKSVTTGGESISLTGTEYKILELLMPHPGHIFTKQQISEYVWESDYAADDSTIMVHISNLRNKLKKADKDVAMIKAVKGLGYKFEKE